eukprot:TRINITY_DN25497_c0_g3_i1.p1 TRINITY_DN25497_c0_g3~~TRINITY_DN25497_c0_g3_i1.p1  ORF type:complete len:273 (+),score=29.19 TRINITY_DN25497_c0_g3_i1:71-889(+)
MAELPLYVRFQGTVYPVSALADDDVRSLMARVNDAVGRPVTSLEYQGETLPLDAPIADVGICAQATLEAGAHHVFRYEGDFDTNGLLYFLGTLGGTEEYKNPHVRGAVRARKWPVWGKHARHWVGRGGVYCRTNKELRPYFMVDLRVATLQVTHYSLRHGRYELDYVLKSWELQASNDGEGWVTLDRREEDSTLKDGENGQRPYHTGTWAVCSPQASESFRMFRIVSWGNWSPDRGEETYLHLSGIELYGAAQLQLDWQNCLAPTGSDDEGD